MIGTKGRKWPSPEEENWRRTDLARLLPRGFLERYGKSGEAVSGEPDSGGDELENLPDGCAAEVITRDGLPFRIRVSPEARSAGLELRWHEHGNLPESLKMLKNREFGEEPNSLISWHWQDMQGVLLLRVPASVRIEGMVLIKECVPQGSSRACSPHVHVEAAGGAEISVLWSLENAGLLELSGEGAASDGMADGKAVSAGEGEGKPGRRHSLLSAVPVSEQSLLNGSLTVIAGANAQVKISLRQIMKPGAVCFVWNRLEAGRDARIDLIESQLGATLVKTISKAVMNAEGSDVRLKGLYLVGRDNHTDVGTLQHHRAPRAVSDALYKGAIACGGRSVFQGLIDVAEKAQKTDSYLTNNNLVLEDGARVDSLPQLNILTDDVKCSHGSTTGRLDDNRLFYLQSRGFSPQEARAELIHAFLAEVIDFAPDFAARIMKEDLNRALEQIR